MTELSRLKTAPARDGDRFFLLRRQLRRAWRSWRRGGDGPLEGDVRRDLPADDLALVRRQIDACLAARGGAVSARATAADLGRAYLSLNDAGKARFFDLLVERYDTDTAAVKEAAAAILAADDVAVLAAAEARMSEALEPPRVRLLKEFNGLEEGVKYLVDMRGDLLAMPPSDKDIRRRKFDREFRDLLASWFDVGFLELRRITWDAPAALLEKLVVYEAVHEIRSWADLKDRLDSDRRCYAFFHPNMPNEPLIFVEVALVARMADSIDALLDENRPATNPEDADTAVFYSISNAQKGLSGVSFGGFLIKQVVTELARDFPNIKTFATLSPVPGFRRWLTRGIAKGEIVLETEDAAVLARATGTGDPAALAALFEQGSWMDDTALAGAMRPVLMHLCAGYLLSTQPARGGGVRAADGVAHFHLSNGARIERLNWLADRSEKGRAQSAGMMVNYLYKLADIECNHENYKGTGKIRSSAAIKALA